MPTLLDLPEFLADWSADHRPISETHREQVGSYIMAIVSREAEGDALGPDDVRESARQLWYRFRLTYDGLRGPYQRSESEDVRRSMGRL